MHKKEKKMKTFSIAGKKPVNIIIKAENKKQAIKFANYGEGYIEDCLDCDIEIEDNPSIVEI